MNVNIFHLVNLFILLFYFLPFKALRSVVELPALGKQRPAELCESEDSLVYRENSSTAREEYGNLVSENRKKERKKEFLS